MGIILWLAEYNKMTSLKIFLNTQQEKFINLTRIYTFAYV